MSRIISSGQFLAGFTRENAELQLTQRLKLKEGQLERLLCQNSVLRTGLSRQQAEKYVQAIRSVGLDVAMEETTKPNPHVVDSVPQKAVRSSSVDKKP